MPVTPVPDTTTFTLQDVVTSVNPTTDDLVDCFADATADSFDQAYKGNLDQLLNFRNYGATASLTSYASSILASSGKACFQPTTQTYYHDGGSPNPIVQDICYSDSAGTTVLATGYYKMTGGASGQKYYIGNSGRVGSVTAC